MPPIYIEEPGGPGGGGGYLPTVPRKQRAGIFASRKVKRTFEQRRPVRLTFYPHRVHFDIGWLRCRPISET